jgi:hypothetical protein
MLYLMPWSTSISALVSPVNAPLPFSHTSCAISATINRRAEGTHRQSAQAHHIRMHKKITDKF